MTSITIRCLMEHIIPNKELFRLLCGDSYVSGDGGHIRIHIPDEEIEYFNQIAVAAPNTVSACKICGKFHRPFIEKAIGEYIIANVSGPTTPEFQRAMRCLIYCLNIYHSGEVTDHMILYRSAAIPNMSFYGAHVETPDKAYKRIIYAHNNIQITSDDHLIYVVINYDSNSYFKYLVIECDDSDKYPSLAYFISGIVNGYGEIERIKSASNALELLSIPANKLPAQTARMVDGLGKFLLLVFLY